MAMQLGSSSGDEEELNASINTTPLVDVMLVLLIIFLITIPVVNETIPLKLPAETNQALQTKPENITISVDVEGNMYWNNAPVADVEILKEKLRAVAVQVPQPEVHIRGDQETRFASIAKVVDACQRSAIVKVGFITLPPPKG